MNRRRPDGGAAIPQPTGSGAPAWSGRLLDLLPVLAALGPVLNGLYMIGREPPWLSALLGASLVTTLVFWVLWRREHADGTRGRLLAALFALAATLAWFAGDGPAGLGMAWVAAVVLARSWGQGAVVLYLCAVILSIGGLHLMLGSSARQTLLEMLFATVLVSVGGGSALLLNRSEESERALAAANAELRRRIGTEQDLVLARERERTARGLHDVLGHRLTAVGLSLEYAERIRDRDPGRAWEEIERARLTTSEALEETRRIVRAMHPVETRGTQGVAAFDAIAESFRSSGIDVRVSVTERAGGSADDLPGDVLLLLVRFAQEGLTNIVRHSEATLAEIGIMVQRNRVDATIEDDGAASTAAPVPGGPAVDGLREGPREGFGLRSLRARAEERDGTFVSGCSERGFAIRISLPLHTEAAEPVDPAEAEVPAEAEDRPMDEAEGAVV